LTLDQAGLGIARLAINDLSGGHQPYRSEDGGVVAVFNGEIYNFRELRADLEAKGHRFASATDGEVIVHLFEEYGPSFVERLNGMFGIAVWDGQQLHLYRDRMGIKPLYTAQVGGVFYFASELKALLEVKGMSRRLDHQALRSYLTLEYVPEPHSIFAEIAKMPKAHYIRAGQQGISQRRYWTFPDFVPSGGCLEDWAERLREILSDAVRLRLVADVPVGVFLSGGLDSSTLTSLMCRHHTEPVHTFSVGFSQRSFDETEYSRAVAARLDTVHHHQTLDSESTLAALDPLAQSLDEPIADPAIIPTYLLSRFARQNVTVALSGEGADELLGGYPTYFAHQLAEPLGLLPVGLWRLLERMVRKIRPSQEYLSLDFKLKKFVSGLGLPQGERHLTWMGSLPWLGDSGILVNPASHALLLDKLGLPSTLVEGAQTLDFHTYLADDLLVKLDRATMMVSLEGRVPFLDHRLVEAMAGLPTQHKLRGMDAKRVLKRVEADRLPAQVLKRQKKGFGVPLAQWLRGPLRPLLEAYLSPAYLRDQGVFRPTPVARLVREHLGGQADHRKPLWTLLVFQRWAENYRPSF
jgi:asparagine synthase (glutamine-hydrolysing)